MDTVLRVLVALTEHTAPATEDMEELRSLAPEEADRPADELACAVLKRVLTARGHFRLLNGH